MCGNFEPQTPRDGEPRRRSLRSQVTLPTPVDSEVVDGARAARPAVSAKPIASTL
jgi:hypothetical protein